MLGMSIMDIADIPVAETDAQFAQVQNAGGGVFETRLRRKDGTHVWAKLATAKLVDVAGKFEGSLAMVTDITEQRQIDELRSQFAAIVETSTDAGSPTFAISGCGPPSRETKSFALSVTMATTSAPLDVAMRDGLSPSGTGRSLAGASVFGSKRRTALRVDTTTSPFEVQRTSRASSAPPRPPSMLARSRRSQRRRPTAMESS